MDEDDDGTRVSEAVPLYEVARGAPEPQPFDPRAKAFRRGVRSLTDTELLALTTGSKQRAPIETVIREYGLTVLRKHGLSGLGTVTVGQLKQMDGITRLQALRLAAVYELRRRVRLAEGQCRRRMTRPADIAREVRDITVLKKEHMVGLYFDAQNGLIHRETISVGSLNMTRTHPREIFHPALTHLAYGVILAHNHPSGSLDASDEDIAFSQSVHRAGEILGIELYDHVIVVAGGGYTSLRERGVF